MLVAALDVLRLLHAAGGGEVCAAALGSLKETVRCGPLEAAVASLSSYK